MESVHAREGTLTVSASELDVGGGFDAIDGGQID